MPDAKLFLIDAHALCYRSFFALPQMSTSKGQPTNAIYGFISTIAKIINDFKPDYFAVCFDSKAKTHRQEKFAEYKIQRPTMPDDLQSQIPIIKEILDAYQLTQFECDGFEADDIIATVTCSVAKKALEVIIVTEDKDMYQLASRNTKFLSTKNNYTLMKERDVNKKLGFKPQHIVDYIALAGDSADNIPGVKGVGEVSAIELIRKYGTIEDILKNLKKNKSLKKTHRLVVEQNEEALFSKELAILETKVPIKFTLEDLTLKEPDRNRLFSIFQDLEFQKLSLEFAPEGGQGLAKLKMQELKSKGDIKNLVNEIKKARICAFLISHEDQKELNLYEHVYISVNGKNIYSLMADKIKDLKEIWVNEDILKITYNLKEALGIFHKYGIKDTVHVYDIMLAGFLLGKYQSSFGLGDLSWNFLNVSLTDESSPAQQVSVLQKLHLVIDKELEKKSLKYLFHDIETPLTYVLFQMECYGVNIDTKLLKELSQKCVREIEKLETQIYKIGGGEFNLNSPKQLSQILFEKLNLPVVKKTKTGFSTNEEVLNILAKDNKIASLVLEFRHLAKLQSTYIDALPKLIDPRTGRIHTQFLQTGTETGRISSKRPNLQNIPIRSDFGRQIRRAIIPSDKDLHMISADYSQIELRILAHLSDDKALKAAFLGGQDIHNYTASLIYDISEDDVTSKMRDSAKRVNFGIIYGMSAFGLAKDLKISQEEAQLFIDKYFMRYPKVKDFMDRSIKHCESQGYVQTLLKRRRYIPEIKSKNMAMRQFAQRQAINTPVQGSAADLIKTAMINIHNEINEKKLTSKMLITVHDELVFEVPSGEKKIMIEMIKEKMEHSFKLSIPMDVSIKIGKNWMEMKEY